jgi:hypothetical protein
MEFLHTFILSLLGYAGASPPPPHPSRVKNLLEGGFLLCSPDCYLSPQLSQRPLSVFLLCYLHMNREAEFMNVQFVKVSEHNLESFQT